MPVPMPQVHSWLVVSAPALQAQYLGRDFKLPVCHQGGSVQQELEGFTHPAMTHRLGLAISMGKQMWGLLLNSGQNGSVYSPERLM